MQVPNALIGDRYRLLEQIGSGGMGVVWRAWDERLQRPVAVKQLRLQVGTSEADAELATQRAMREARITARLHHPHAVAVFDVVEHEGQPCLVMQYVPSVPLSAVLRDGGPLSLDEAARMGAEVAGALAAAHQLGIVHRDVKPGNILVAEDGGALLSDFGISRAFDDATLTSTGMVHGTPAYFAPEIARGASADAASDVYSFGATLYAALEGAPPFGTDSNPIALLYRVAAGEVDPPVRSGPLGPLVMRMLAKEPADRPAMAQVAAELAALRTRPLSPTPAPAPAPVEPTLRLPAAPVAAAASVSAASSEPSTVPVAATPPAAAASLSTNPRPVALPSTPAPAPRRRYAWVVVTAVLVLAALVAAVLIGQSDGAGVAGDPATGSSSAPAPTSAAPTGSGSEEPSAEPSASPSATEDSPSATPSASPSPSPTRTPTPRASSGAASESELAGAVRDYYGELPDETDAAWDALTRRYQSATGGRANYDGFWAQFRQVNTSQVKGTEPNRVEATVRYTYTDGRRVSERRSFTLVADDGVLKIDASEVLG